MTPLVRYLRVQAEFESTLRVLLENAYGDANAHLKSLEASESIGDQIRRRQIRQAQSSIARELAQLYSNANELIKAERAAAAAAAIDALYDPLIPLLQEVGFDKPRIDAMLRSQRATAERGVQNAVTRVTVSSIPLSERVYHSRVLVNGQLDHIITSAIARGVSAAELAKAVRPFIDPNTPGGVRYAAQRLGRTELNNAFHGTQIASAVESPFVEAMRWHLSGSHPRPDECNEYAAGGDVGDGLWTPERVPVKPHPNCLCYMTAEVPSRAQFLANYRAGRYDEWIDAQIAG